MNRYFILEMCLFLSQIIEIIIDFYYRYYLIAIIPGIVAIFCLYGAGQVYGNY